MLQRPVFSFLAVFVGLGACAPVDDGSSAAVGELSGRPACQFVRCVYPLCAPDQHLVVPIGQCCPVCRGPVTNDRCATVLCAAVVCGEGKVLVRHGNDCCGRCVTAPSPVECNIDDDCPQYVCVRCPCPVSSCQGRRCVTQTPSETTCGGS